MPKNWAPSFSDDHRFLDAGTKLLRASDLTPVRDSVNPVGDSDLQTWWSQSAGQLEIHLIGPPASGSLAPAKQSIDGQVLVFQVETGQLLHRLPFSWKAQPYNFELALSDDESRLALSENFDFADHNLTEVWDLKRGISLGRRIQLWETTPASIPHSHEFLTVDSDYEDCHIVCESPAAGPTALIPGQGIHAFSRDGNLIAFYGADIQIFQRVGRECRESTLGILGMPHTWLLLIASIALFISLCLDARRLRISPFPRFQAPGLIFLAVGAVAISLFMLLRICLAQPFLTPAPLLLIVVIGLFINSRFWRSMSIVFLGATCIWIIDQLRRLPLSRGSFSGASPHWILDRRYQIPNAMLADLLLYACGICLLMLLSLLLKPRPSPAIALPA